MRRECFIIGPPDASGWSGWHRVRADFGGNVPAPVAVAPQAHPVRRQSGSQLCPDNPSEFSSHSLALRQFHGGTMRICASGTPSATGQLLVQRLFAWMTLRLNRSDRDQEKPCFQSGSVSLDPFLQPVVTIKVLSLYRGERPIADANYSGDTRGHEQSNMAR